MSVAEIDDLYLTEVWEYDAFTLKHPPADLLIASYLGYKAPEPKQNGSDPRNIREAAKANSESLVALRPMLGRAGARPKTADDLPAFLRTPEKAAMIQQMKTDMGG